MGFYIVNGLGDTIDSPSREQMRDFLDAIEATDEEHGAAWLATDEKYVLEWSVDGRLVLSTPDAHGVRHLRDVSRAKTIDLWCALARGDVAAVERQPWKEGNGYVQTPERVAELQRHQREQDREFYDSLGAERGDTRCRREGCPRGAVAHSVLCRAHHFESLTRRPCPFSD